MHEINYYNITPNDWKGTKLNFIGNVTACNRLMTKIIKIIQNDSDEFIGDYSFDISTSPMLHIATTIFVIDTKLPSQQIQIANINKVLLVNMSYESATGFYFEQKELENTDYQMLKVLEKYVNIPKDDINAITLLNKRNNLRISLNLRKLK